MEEVWKDIAGYEELYQVSNMGRVKSLDKYVNTKGEGIRLIKGKMLSPTFSGKYLCINMNKDGILKRDTIHRLVAKTFLANPDNKPCVDHIDTNPLNNRIDNLRWVTYYENNQNAITKNNWYNSIKSPVGQYDYRLILVSEYDSIKDAAKNTGLNATCISNAANGKNNGRYAGYIWEHLNKQ